MARRNSLINPVLGGAAILVALYTILFGSVSSFEVEDAERILSDLSSHLSEEAGHRGKEAKFQYSSLEVNGFAYDKWAHVIKPSFDFIHQQWQGGKRFGISTESADFIPNHAMPERITLRMKDAFNIIMSSQLLAIIQPAQPVVYSINLKPKDVTDAVRHRLTIPGNLSITTLDPKHEITLQLATPVQAEAVFFSAQHQLRAHATAGAIKASTGHGLWSLHSADMRYDSVQRSSRVIESKGTLTLDNIGFTRGNINPAPFTATAAWTLRSQRNISGATDAAQLDIEHGLIADGDVKISINGTLNFDIEDALFGEVVVEVNNVLSFLQSAWIISSKRDAAHELLNEIIGSDAESEPNRQLFITISRTKNGPWMIGKITLEELLNKGFLDLFTFLQSQETHDETSSHKANNPT